VLTGNPQAYDLTLQGRNALKTHDLRE
jgi:hypothetical protein